MFLSHLHFAPQLNYQQIEEERYRWIISLNDDADEPNYLDIPTSTFFFQINPHTWSSDWQSKTKETVVACTKFLRELHGRQPSWKILCVGSAHACALIYFLLLLCDYSDLNFLQRHLKQRIPNFTTIHTYFPRLLTESILVPFLDNYCC